MTTPTEENASNPPVVERIKRRPTRPDDAAQKAAIDELQASSTCHVGLDGVGGAVGGTDSMSQLP
jgi:hypothetical protein